MGTNLFVEGHPAPVVISIRLPTDVTRFEELRRVAAALALIDKEASAQWITMWPGMQYRRRREIRLLQFRVSSPPWLSILADPAWLALFFTVLTFYKQAKESAVELKQDVRHGLERVMPCIERIQGLSQRQKQLLEIAVRLSVDKILATGEKTSLRMADRFARARKQLVADKEDELEVKVDDIENNRTLW